jgi:hypothetical protein
LKWSLNKIVSFYVELKAMSRIFFIWGVAWNVDGFLISIFRGMVEDLGKHGFLESLELMERKKLLLGVKMYQKYNILILLRNQIFLF